MSGPLITEQLQNWANIDRFISNLKKCSKAKCTKGYLHGRLEGLHEKWKQFEALHMKIVLLVDDDIQKTSPYFTTDMYTQYEDLYYENVGRIKDSLDSFMVDTSVTLATDVSQSMHTQPRLPPIDIPKFTGSYAEWRPFHDLFSSLVGQNSNLEDVQKLYYLKASVAGEAEQLLRCYSVASSNYESAWKALCSRYDNKRLLINAQLSLLLSQTVISKDTSNTIRNLYDITVEKTRQLWEQQISNSTDPPTIKKYLDFLEGRFRTLEALTGSLPKPVRKQTYTILSNNNSTVCACCEHDHHLRKCQKFQSFPTERRIEFVKSKSLCYNCLAHDHISTKCPSKKGCFRCGRRHHTLLHLNSPTIGSSVEPSRNPSVTSLHATDHSNQVLLSTALVVAKSNGRELPLRALIDTGSQSSFITTATMQRLHLVPRSIRATIQGIGNTPSTTKTTSRIVHFDIFSGFDDSCAIPVEAIVLSSLTGQLPQSKLFIPSSPHLNALNLADPTFQQPGRIDAILGADIYPFIIRDGIKTGPIHTPIAQNTTLGWILIGPTQSASSSTPIYTFFSQTDLDHQLRRFWEIEEVEPFTSTSEDDTACEEHFKTTHSRSIDGRYTVALPFKSSSEQLGSSYHRALIQLDSLHRRLSKNPSLREAYTQCLKEYVELGHMEKIAGDDINLCNHYYLSHHGVIKQSSATTKLRVVFNASSKSSSGLALNDLLHIGPRLQPDIASIITKWRTSRIAFSSDMEKMYRQIQMTESDSNFQRILWRKDPNNPIEHFRLKTVTFGVASAPFLAMRTIKQLVQDDGADYSLAANALREHLYVDNILCGADDVQEALETQRQLTTLLHRGGFKLRQWAANNFDLLKQVPEADRLYSPEVDISCETLAIHLD